jgi:hypothetical protein
MKIPKKIQNIIDRRERLAMELLDVCEKLDSWLEKNGADLTDSDIADSTISGCMIYCEPEKQKQPCCICKGHKANEPFEIRDDFGVLYKTSHISNCPYCGRFLTENYS